MNKIYEYELSVYDFEQFHKHIEGIIRIVSSQKFKEYLGERLNEALRFIQRELLTTVNTELQEEMSNFVIIFMHFIIKDVIWMHGVNILIKTYG